MNVGWDRFVRRLSIGEPRACQSAAFLAGAWRGIGVDGLISVLQSNWSGQALNDCFKCSSWIMLPGLCIIEIEVLALHTSMLAVGNPTLEWQSLIVHLTWRLINFQDKRMRV